jgi:hypothetical protein
VKAIKNLVLMLGVLAFVAVSVVRAQGKPEPTTIIMTGAPTGGVKFEHKLHSKDRGIKCETCHHAAKPEKAPASANQACRDCHTKAPAAPMKTKTQAAFHNPMAKTGVCIDCHAKEVKAGKKAPLKCAECHKKENA